MSDEYTIPDSVKERAAAPADDGYVIPESVTRRVKEYTPPPPAPETPSLGQRAVNFAKRTLADAAVTSDPAERAPGTRRGGSAVRPYVAPDPAPDVPTPPRAIPSEPGVLNAIDVENSGPALRNAPVAPPAPTPPVPVLERPSTNPPSWRENSDLVQMAKSPDTLAREAADARYEQNRDRVSARPLNTAQNLSQDFREFTKNPVARGAAAGVAQLGQTGIGAVRLAADLMGADKVADFAKGAGQDANTIADGAGRGLVGNDKLVADVTSSIMNSVPSMALGTIGGPALKTLFVQSALAEYGSGRDAGFGIAESAARGGIYGAAEAIGERFGFPEQIALLKSVSKRLPAGEAAKMFGELIKKEIPGEQLTTLMEFLADKFGPAALKPDATIADYLEAAGETLKLTVAQTAVMGGGPVALQGARAATQNADKAIDRSVMTQPERAAAAVGFLRPIEQRKAADDRLDDFAATHGIPPAVVKATKEAAAKQPLSGLTGFYKRAVTSLAKRGLVGGQIDDTHLGALDEPAPVAPQAPDAKQEVAPVADAAINASELVDEPTGAAAEQAAPAAEPQAETTAPPRTVQTVAGAPINRNWSAFTPESGTLGIPRDQMPQISAEHRGALVNFLSARGVTHETMEVPASELSPTQAEFSPQKVQGATEYQGGDRSILVSQDGHILDGTHQWLAKLDADEPVKVIRLGAPTQDLLRLAHQFPSSTTARGPATRQASGVESEGIPESNNADERNTSQQDARVLDMGRRASTMQQPEAPGVQKVRGQGDQNGAGVGGRLSGVLEGSGAAPEPQAQLGPDQRAPRLPAGERQVGDFAGAISESSKLREAPGVQRQASNRGRVGEGTGNPNGDDPRSDEGGAPDRRNPLNGEASIGEAGNQTADGQRDNRLRNGVGAAPGNNDRSVAQTTGARVVPRTDAGDSDSRDGTDATTRVIARAGRTPSSAEPLALKPNNDGGLTAFLGGRELLDFESATPLTFPADVTDAAAKKAIRTAGSLSTKVNFYSPTNEQNAAQGTAAKAPADQAPTAARSDAAGAGTADVPAAGASAPAPAGVAPPAPKVDQRRARAKARMAFNPETDSVLQALAKMGGIRRDVVAKEFGLKPEELKHTVATGGLKGFPFRKTGGMGLDDTITALQEAGYFPGVSDEDVRGKLEEAIYSELGGGRELTIAGQMRRAEELAADQPTEDDPFAPGASASALDAFTPDELDESGYADADPEVKALTQRLLQDAEAAGLDTEALRETAAMQTETQPEEAYHAAIQEAIRQALAGDRAGAQVGNAEAARGSSEDRGVPAGVQGQEGQGEGLTLSSQNADELKAKTAREANAAALDERQQIDAERDLFGLQQQAAPDQRTDNTGDMFGGPSAADVQAARSRKGGAPSGPDLFSEQPSEPATNTGYTIAEKDGKFFVRIGDDRASRGPFKTRDAAAKQGEALQQRETMAADEKAAGGDPIAWAGRAAFKAGQKREAPPEISQANAPRWLKGYDDAALAELRGPQPTPPKGPSKPKNIASEAGDSEDVRQAKADALKALGDLSDIIGKPGKALMTPEQEQKLLPVLTRLMDAAFRLGYLKFKEAAKFALDQIRAALGSEAADQISIDHLQGAYIGMAGRYKEQGADVVEHTTGKGKVIKGVIRADLTQAQAKEIDPYTWKKDGGYFIRLEHLAKLNEQFPPAAMEDTPDYGGADALAQPRLAYTAKRDDRTPDLFAAPGPQEAAGPATAPADGVRRAGGALPGRNPRFTGLGIAADIQRAGSAALDGRQVRSPDDLAQLAQVFRDPRYETVRVFFVKENRVIHSTAVSARLPGTAPMIPAGVSESDYFSRFREMLKQTGADGYYILHNHPSGDPTPSQADVVLTNRLNAEAPGMLGHVVVNSNRYAVIQPGKVGLLGWKDAAVDVRTREFGPEMLLKAGIPSAFLGRRIGSPQDLVAIGKSIQKPGWLTLIGVGSDGNVRALADVPRSALSRPDNVLAAMARRFARLSGSRQLHLVGSAADIASQPVQRALNAGVLLDAVGEGSQTSGQMGLRGGDHAFNKTPGRVVAEDSPSYEDSAWAAPAKSNFDNFVYKFQDKQIDLKRSVEAIKRDAGAIEDRWDAYLQEELFYGRAAKRVQDFVHHELDPLLREMKLRGLSIADVDQYLHARHAEEANKLIAERNKVPDEGQTGIDGKVIESPLQDGGSGMKTADARAYLEGLDPAQRKRLEAVAAKVDGIIASTRNLTAAYGLESKDVVDGWAKLFEHYVPLQREDKGSGLGTGQGFSIRGRESKHRTGSTSKVIDILANIAMQRERTIVRGEKNRVAVALVGLAKLNPNPDVWTVDKVPTRQVLNEQTGLVETQEDRNFKSNPNVLVAKILGRDGKAQERAVVFNEHNDRAVRMAAALKNLDAAQLEGLLGATAKVTRYFSSVNTQYNPVFGVVNLTRDLQHAMLALQATELKGHTAEVMGHVGSALKGIYVDARAVRKDKAPTSPWAKLWEEFQNEGGQTGYREMFRTSQDRADAIQGSLDPTHWMQSPLGKVFTAGGALKVPLAVAQQKAGWLFDWLSDYNEAMENAVRLSSYKVATEQGMSKQRAASLAKNLTVNFNRKGQAGQQAGALYAFFNAAMQGTASIGRVVLERVDGKTRISALGKKVIGGGIALGVLQGLMLAAAGLDDDDPPQFVREKNLIIPIGGKRYLTIPMPQGFHVLANLGRIPTEWAMGGFRNSAKRALQVMGVFADAFNPLGSSTALQTVAPTALDPLAALAENKDWTGKPIARTSFNSATPGYTLARDTASSPAKWIAEAVNYLSGGSAYRAGMFSPTPDQIDYLFGQATGGVGREVSKGEQAIKAMFSGEELAPHKIPLLGRFYGNANASSSQGTRFYENVHAMALHEAEIKGLAKAASQAKTDAERKQLDGERAAYLRDNPEAALFRAADGFDRSIQKLRAEKRRLLADGGSREKVRQIEDQITETMKAFNDQVAARRKAEPVN